MTVTSEIRTTVVGRMGIDGPSHPNQPPDVERDTWRSSASIGDAQSPMKIAIASINYHPEPTGIAVYSTGMAEYFANQGHDVHVYTGFPYYPAWAKPREYQGRWYQRTRLNRVQLHRSYLYVPKRPSALRRIIHELSFTVSATIAYLLGPRADVTIIVSPPLAIGIPIMLIARLKGSATVFHVQDLQPDTAVELGMLRPGLLTRMLYALERITYASVDRVSTISDAMLDRIHSKKVPTLKTLLFKNWADSQLVRRLSSDESLRSEWQLEDKFIVLYAGNLGKKQGLGSLLDVAEHLREVDGVMFVIVGDGNERDLLAARVRSAGLSNVLFKAPVPREQLGRMLAIADVSVIPQRADVQDLVLPSKLGNLLSSGRPLVVAASPESDLGRTMVAGRCAILVEPDDHVAMAEAILALRADPVRCEMLATAGMAFAGSAMSREAILDGFLAELSVLTVSRKTLTAVAVEPLQPAPPAD